MLEGRGVGIGPGGRGVTFHSFSFCLPLIAKLLFLREMQGATLNQYFCRAFINYGLKSTNLSSTTCFNHLLPKPIASCLALLWLGLESKLQKTKTNTSSQLPFEMKTYKHMRIRLIYAIWWRKRKKREDFCAILSVNNTLFKYVWFTWLSSSNNKNVFYSLSASECHSKNIIQKLVP